MSSNVESSGMPQDTIIVNKLIKRCELFLRTRYASIQSFAKLEEKCFILVIHCSIVLKYFILVIHCSILLKYFYVHLFSFRFGLVMIYKILYFEPPSFPFH